ncbi:MAG: N-6 DNA methylase, partial [Ktedonobacteraceae bacterium]
MNNKLAACVAALARLLRDAIMQTWPGDDGAADLCRLLPDMTPEQCTDMIAQMACCALFAAYSHHIADVPFTRTHLVEYVPQIHPLLHAVCSYLANPDLDERVACVVDRLIETLNGVDFDVINDHTTSRDALSHFYETFLAVYDAALRGRRGVYYTPEQIVSYIVRGVDHLLKTDFAMPDGLADAASHLLDPAVGTGAFLSGLIAHIHHSFKGAAGQWQDYVAQNLLPRLSGYELLATPYAIAHLQLTLQLAETGYDFRAGDSLHLSLANALEHESGADAAPSPLVVIVGNPPYAGHSANDGAWIAALLHGCDQRTGQRAASYFEVDGVPISERNVKWLNDDYVKFMRYAQWRIERAGAGILAFVTNHGYLENPTFRGMRRALMQSFDAIYALDLHGNSKKNARAPGNTRDENVFDIRQGIAISIFVRHMSPGADQTREAKVYHADLWGLRADKYRWLAMHDCATTPWVIVEPAPPFYLFVPRDTERRAEYERGWPITAIMPVNSLGVLTKRDALAVGFSAQELLQKIAIFADPGRSDVECAAQFGVP